MCFIQKMLCFQDSLYNEDYLGLRLSEKDQDIVQLKEDNAVKLQQLVQSLRKELDTALVRPLVECL